MRLTPLDIKKQEFARNFRGFDPEEVQTFLQLLATQWEEILNEKRQLEEKLREAQSSLTHYQRLEEALGEAVKTAKESAQNVIEVARQNAASILTDAELKAEEIKKHAERSRQAATEARTHIEHKRDEILVRLRSFLSAELELMKRYDDSEKKTETPEVPVTFYQTTDEVTFSSYEKGPVRFYTDETDGIPVPEEPYEPVSDDGIPIGTIELMSERDQVPGMGSLELAEADSELSLNTEESSAAIDIPEETQAESEKSSAEPGPVDPLFFEDRPASQWVVRPLISNSLRNGIPILDVDLEDTIDTTTVEMTNTAEEIQRIRKILQDLD